MNLEISSSEIQYLQQKLVNWGRENFHQYPWRNLDNKWHSLVAEIMLQRTNADQVEPEFTHFEKKYPTPKDYIADNNSSVFSNLGLPQRREWLKDLARYLENHDVPDDKSELLQLPGVGDYISSAYRSLHRGLRDRIIDSNVVRFYGRYFGFQTHGETRRKKWFIQLAEKLTPTRIHRKYNYALLDFTREVCKPKPRCSECPLKNRCSFFLSASVEES